MNTLISVAQLSSLLGEATIMIFDCRNALMDPAAGRKAYDKAHIPGAFYADMSRDLSTPHHLGKTGRHPLPAQADWIRKVQSWGLHPALQVVLYDDNGGASAARLWWMLQWIGHAKAAVLNGGWQAWISTVNGDARVPARIPGEGGLPAIEDAPGSYVKFRLGAKPA